MHSCRAGYTGVITANTSPPSYHNGLCEPFLLSAHVLLPLLLGVVLPVELAATWAIVQLHGKTAVSRAPLVIFYPVLSYPILYYTILY
eukprot:g71644.t1